MWIKNKILFSKLLCLLSAFCLVSWFAIYFSVTPVKSFATGDSFIRLTIEQTLALYGAEFEVTYYRLNQNDSITCKAVYCGDTSMFTPRSVIDSLSFNGSYFYDPHDARALTNEDYASGGLVYALVPSLSPGGTISVPFTSWQPSSTSDHANISIDFPVTFSGISRFVQPVFWTLYNQSDTTPDRTTFSYSTSIGLQTNTACRRNPSGSFFSRYGMGLMSFASDPHPLYWSDVPEDHLHNVGCLFADLGNPDLSEIFDVTGIHYSINNFGSLSVTSEGPSFPDRFGYLGFIADGYVPFIVIGRPAIYGYNPPVVTTTQSTVTGTNGFAQTGATYTQQTVDLSNLESGVAAIVQQEIYNGDTLDWIGENVRRSTDNLAIIIGQLNQIYAKMCESGEIAVDLVPADPLHTLPTDLQNLMHNAMQSYTTARLPQATNGLSLMNTLYSKLTGNGMEFFGLFGGFTLSITVLCWFVFRGRH